MGSEFFGVFSWKNVEIKIEEKSLNVFYCETKKNLRASNSIAKWIRFLFTTLHGSFSHPSTVTLIGSGFFEPQDLTSNAMATENVKQKMKKPSLNIFEFILWMKICVRGNKNWIENFVAIAALEHNNYWLEQWSRQWLSEKFTIVITYNDCDKSNIVSLYSLEILLSKKWLHWRENFQWKSVIKIVYIVKSMNISSIKSFPFLKLSQSKRKCTHGCHNFFCIRWDFVGVSE